MCLTLTPDSVEHARRLKQGNNPITVYKVLRDERERGLWSPYGFTSFKWESGLNISSRPSKEITKWEQTTEEIEEGFHFFLKRIDAMKEYFWFQETFPLNRYVIVPVKVDPEDIVSKGVFESAEVIVTTRAWL